MEFGEGKMQPGELIELTDEQKRARKFRNIAIGLALAFMVGAFYYGSVARFSSKLGERAATVAAEKAAADKAAKDSN
ncbi:MAG: hypothetical protein V3V02_02680 [Rhizobiaceae bacterium]